MRERAFAAGFMANFGAGNYGPTAHTGFTKVNDVWAVRKIIAPSSKSTLTNRKVARFRRATSSPTQHFAQACPNEGIATKKRITTRSGEKNMNLERIWIFPKIENFTTLGPI